VRELLSFAWRHKAFWIVPLIMVLILIGLIVFADYNTAPFQYNVR